MLTIAIQRPPDAWRTVAEALAANVPWQSFSRSLRGEPTIGSDGQRWINQSHIRAAADPKFHGNEWNAQDWPANVLTGYSWGVTAADYIVWSYRTPIAWRVGTHWLIPDIRYSATTSRHQALLRTAAHYLETQGNVYASA